jgi:hypothetical protein
MARGEFFACLERRPRDRKDIVVPDDAGTPAPSLDHSLVLKVARGRAWMKALREGEYAGTAEIASKCGLSEPIRKAHATTCVLAPDIVEAIVEGQQPRKLTSSGSWLLCHALGLISGGETDIVPLSIHRPTFSFDTGNHSGCGVIARRG